MNRFGVWRCGVGALAALAITALLAWLGTRAEPLPPLELAAWAGALFGVAMLGGSLMRMPAVALRWDGRQWWLARVSPSRGAAAEVDAMPGDIEVALDLGGWMLLRFRPQPALSPRPRYRPRWPIGHAQSTWLPVQRLGLEAHWHALRCAVYSPRPAPARDAADPS
ncbi:MAG TPA: hypothetical protein VJO99_19900 [Burkholderiaceae bacterium]|nr:hypothetical protein [Burkholderiaceae bacterium]